MILLVTYDKNDYNIPIKNLHEAIKLSSIAYWHHLNNTWIIRTNLTLNDVYTNISHNISDKDRLIIVEIKRNYQGWLNKNAWEWLNKQFKEDSFFGF